MEKIEAYKAKDGKLFETSWDCSIHEKEIVRNAVESIAKKIDIPFIDWCNGETAAYIVRLSCREDFEHLKEWLMFETDNDLVNEMKEPETYPNKSILIVDECWMDLRENVSNVINRMRNAITEML